MIDLHSHLLVDWDDGPSQLSDALEMLKIAKEEGIEKIVVTPHFYRLNRFNDNVEIMNAKFKELAREASNLSLVTYLSPEIYIHPNLIDNIESIKKLSINNGVYIYIEFPQFHIPSGWRNILFKITANGLIPIISHPERNIVIQENPSILYEMTREGILSMGTAASLTGGFGPYVKKVITYLLSHNLITFIATDAHDHKDRPPRLKEAVEEASKIIGKEYALAMVTKIPQAILENRAIPEIPEPIYPRRKNIG